MIRNTDELEVVVNYLKQLMDEIMDGQLTKDQLENNLAIYKDYSWEFMKYIKKEFEIN